MSDAPAAPSKIDGVLCSAQYPEASTTVDQMKARDREFGPLLGTTRTHSRHVPGNLTLVTAHPSDLMYQHGNGPRAGQDRYDWMDRGDGVSYGMLRKPDPTPKNDSVEKIEKRKAELQAQAAELREIDPAKRTPQQSADLARLTDWLDRLYGIAPPTSPNQAAHAAPHAPSQTAPPSIRQETGKS